VPRSQRFAITVEECEYRADSKPEPANPTAKGPAPRPRSSQSNALPPWVVATTRSAASTVIENGASPWAARLPVSERRGHRADMTGIGARRGHARAGSRRPTQSCLRCRTGISSATPRVLRADCGEAARWLLLPSCYLSADPSGAAASRSSNSASAAGSSSIGKWPPGISTGSMPSSWRAMNRSQAGSKISSSVA
jgi:hypothetical protein